MSTQIVPDMHRHIARKSTVSRSVKAPTKTLPLSNPPLNVDRNSREEPPVFHALQCDVKLEKEIPGEEQVFVILPDNDIEQMNVEQADEEIVSDLIEQIQRRISEYSAEQVRSTCGDELSIPLDRYKIAMNDERIPQIFSRFLIFSSITRTAIRINVSLCSS